MSAEDPYRLSDTVLEGRYKVIRHVAAGGFGVVYEGLHETLQKPVAIKVLKTPSHMNAKAAAAIHESFVLEARTIARLTHPSIVQVLDLGVSKMPNGDDAPWMALEWLPGKTLRDWLAERTDGPLLPAGALALLHPIFSALAYAHENGIAHRDIKPANIMVVESKSGLQLRLMDFGIAKLMEEGEAAGKGDTRTASDFATYTRKYGAPEQASGRRTGPWTDVHALALILTEILIGGPAYGERDPRAILGEILAAERPTPGRLGVDVGTWEPVLARAMTQNPADRYPNAAEFLAALEQMQPGGARSIGEQHQVLVTASVTPAPVRSSDSLSGAMNPYRQRTVLDENLSLPSFAATALAPSHGAIPTQGERSYSTPFVASSPWQTASNQYTAPAKTKAPLYAALGLVATLLIVGIGTMAITHGRRSDVQTQAPPSPILNTPPVNTPSVPAPIQPIVTDITPTPAPVVPTMPIAHADPAPQEAPQAEQTTQGGSPSQHHTSSSHHPHSSPASSSSSAPGTLGYHVQ